MPELSSALILLVLGIALAYLYAFVGGFTDAANAIATAVGTRAFTPRQAVLVAAVFEVLGALTGTAVALTIGQGIVPPHVLTQTAVAAALLGAMSWSLATYYLGIPVSETHGLIGGIVGETHSMEVIHRKDVERDSDRDGSPVDTDRGRDPSAPRRHANRHPDRSSDVD